MQVMKMTFSDGMSFDLSGPLRVVHRKDGYYVVGQQTLCPVDSRADGEELIAELTKAERRI
jgi:hypothetical protein